MKVFRGVFSFATKGVLVPAPLSFLIICKYFRCITKHFKLRWTYIEDFRSIKKKLSFQFTMNLHWRFSVDQKALISTFSVYENTLAYDEFTLKIFGRSKRSSHFNLRWIYIEDFRSIKKKFSFQIWIITSFFAVPKQVLISTCNNNSMIVGFSSYFRLELLTIHETYNAFWGGNFGLFWVSYHTWNSKKIMHY